MMHRPCIEVPIEIPLPAGMMERNDDVHDLQFGYDGDLDEDDRQGDAAHKPLLPEMELIKEALVRQADALEKLAVGVHDISKALQQIAMVMAPPAARVGAPAAARAAARAAAPAAARAAAPAVVPPFIPPQVEIIEIPYE